VDEFATAGLTPVPSGVVKPPRVGESPVNLECSLVKTVPLSTQPLGGSVVIGQVVLFHVDDRLLNGMRIDQDQLRAIGRMGGAEYTRTGDRFRMVRPTV
jgi:flavin reductase (DIM6/NTAB) family NADH-FMN oxidoreductase RutF